MRSAYSLIVLGLIMMAVSEASSQDVDASATYGGLFLEAGLSSEPLSVSLTAGGSDQVDIDGCGYGYVSSAPDVGLFYTYESTSGGSDLYVYAEGEGDITLLIYRVNFRMEDDDWMCDDDSYGNGNPIIVIPIPEFERFLGGSEGFLIWVGSYTEEFHDATLYISEIDPRGNGSTSSGQVPDYSFDPTYGSETLQEDFLPDPYTVDLVAGGSINLDIGECTYGYVAEAPDFDLYYETNSGGSDLYIYASSEEDTTLLVNTPDGNWLCNDDGHYDSHPLIVVPKAAEGLYDIWVGSYDGDAAGATLYISQIDPR